MNDGPLALAQKALFERQENYGHPAENFAHIAALWEALFGWKVSAEDVAMAMVLMKLSRLYRTPGHKDSAVDVAGYIEAYAMVVEYHAEKRRSLRRFRLRDYGLFGMLRRAVGSRRGSVPAAGTTGPDQTAPHRSSPIRGRD